MNRFQSLSKSFSLLKPISNLKFKQPIFLQQKRSLYIKKSSEFQHWDKISIEKEILNCLHDYADCYPEDVNMLANLEHDLLMSKHDRFGFQWDLQEVFQFDITEGRTWSRDLQSGKEASDFVASILEEEGRLVYTF